MFLPPPSVVELGDTGPEFLLGALALDTENARHSADCLYSARNASIGSTLVALLAGR